MLAKPGYVERFNAEAIAVARLNHPGIVHVYAIDEIESVHFIAMEYVEGTNLRNSSPAAVPSICPRPSRS